MGGLGEVGKLGQARNQVRGMKVKLPKMGTYHGGNGGPG